MAGDACGVTSTDTRGSPIYLNGETTGDAKIQGRWLALRDILQQNHNAVSTHTCRKAGQWMQYLRGFAIVACKVPLADALVIGYFPVLFTEFGQVPCNTS